MYCLGSTLLRKARESPMRRGNPTPDLPLQLHFALFEDSGGYVLKPREMCDPDSSFGWPPPRDTLSRVSVQLLSLHGLPQRGEERPRLQGKHSATHAYVPTLSGSYVAPSATDPSSPRIKLSLHPIGGFCSVSTELPPCAVKVEHRTPKSETNGLNPRFGEQVHCLVAEPHETMLRVAACAGDFSVASGRRGALG